MTQLAKKTFEAIYQNGVLRPLSPVEGLEENEQVSITLTQEARPHPLADCFGILPEENARQMLEIVEMEFEQVDADEWK